MSDDVLRQLRDLIQVDVNHRGLATDPDANLINAFPDDFAAACRSIAETPDAALCIVTGFYIADADPPAGETDGPLGALFLARALAPMGIHVALATDPFCHNALQVGVHAAGLGSSVRIHSLGSVGAGFPRPLVQGGETPPLPRFSHLVALERVGPSWAGPCYNMRGRDITSHMAPAHLLFDPARGEGWPALITIGIGDGGNEIGMGKIPQEVIRRNVPNGELIACCVPTDHLIVCGVSNWGAYALAAGVALLRGAMLDPTLFDVERERQFLRIMVEQGPLGDGVTARPTVTVDGLSFEEYVRPLTGIRDILRV